MAGIGHLNLRSLSVGVVMAVVSSGAGAGWVDDFITGNQSLGPRYFDNQQRGYYTFGRFSMRYPSRNEPLVTFQPPAYRGGCGGMDLFLGGMSFMDPDYLVEKFQRIIQTAPALMFDMALKTVSEKLAGSMKELDNIIDQLGQTMANDCRAANKLIKIATSQTERDETAQSIASVANATTESVTGIARNMMDSFSNQASNGDAPQDEQELIRNCPQAIVDAINSGSVVEYAAGKVGLGAYAPLIRGMFGDLAIGFDEAGSRFFAGPVPPCSVNDPRSFELFITGEAEVKVWDEGSGQYVCELDDSERLDQYVMNMMDGIVVAMQVDAAFSDDERRFIDESPIPVYAVLRAASLTDQTAHVASIASSVIATAYGYAILRDLYFRTRILTDEMQQVLARKKGVLEGCNIPAIADAGAFVEEMQNRLYEGMVDIRTVYAQTATEVNAIMELVSRFKVIEKESERLIATHLNGPI